MPAIAAQSRLQGTEDPRLRGTRPALLWGRQICLAPESVSQLGEPPGQVSEVPLEAWSCAPPSVKVCLVCPGRLSFLTDLPP